MGRMRIRQAVIVEGKYDKIRLEGLIDALILTTNGFGVFSDKELRGFIRRLAAERGIVVLTDSDAAGFKIRGHLGGLVPPEQVTHVYIPEIMGKERRKRTASAEGKLGVEGMDMDTLRRAFTAAGVTEDTARTPQRPITMADWYADGLAGGRDSRERRWRLYDQLGLPRRINSAGALRILNAMMDYDDYRALLEKVEPVAD